MQGVSVMCDVQVGQIQFEGLWLQAWTCAFSSDSRDVLECPLCEEMAVRTHP